MSGVDGDHYCYQKSQNDNKKIDDEDAKEEKRIFTIMFVYLWERKSRRVSGVDRESIIIIRNLPIITKGRW